MTNSNNTTNKNNDTKKITALVALIITVMISTTSATYAYLAFQASNNNVVTGTVADAGLTLTVTESPLKTNTGRMVPQLETALGTAINSTNKCVDGNGNIVCKVYTITATSASNATIPATATIQFTHTINNTPNLKWKLIQSASQIGTVGTATTATASKAAFATPTFSNSTKTHTYYMVVWINEINAVQNDTGTWSATISFDTANGGITSTIRS